MGWKISLVLIENKARFLNDVLLLQKAGFRNIELVDVIDFETALDAKDSICIGEVKDTIVVCDAYKLTEFYLSDTATLELTESEKNISALFPNSEILSVACHSVVDFHGYSLIQNGIKTRSKIVSPEERKEYGVRFEEEKQIYKEAIPIDNELFWNLDGSDDQEEYYSESQMMEEFTFGVAKRRLGVELNLDESETVLQTKNFRVYKVGEFTEAIKKENSRFKIWKRILFYIVVFLIYQAIRHYTK